MSDLPDVNIAQLTKAVNNAEMNGPAKSFDTLCINVANSSWGEANDIDNGTVGELIIHHKVTTKTLKPGETAPELPKPAPVAETTVQQPEAKILAPAGSADIKTYAEGGKGKKQCPDCKKYLGIRATVCVCGHAFVKKAVAVPVASSGVDDVDEEPEAEETSSQASVSRRSSGGGISTPSGACPSSLTGTDLASVKRWAETVRKHYSNKSQYLTVEGLRYFAREFYGIHTAEFNQVKLRLLEIYNED